MTKQDIIEATDRAIDKADGNYDVLADGSIEIDAFNVAQELGVELEKLERIFDNQRNALKLLRAGVRLMVSGEEDSLTIIRKF